MISSIGRPVGQDNDPIHPGSSPPRHTFLPRSTNIHQLEAECIQDVCRIVRPLLKQKLNKENMYLLKETRELVYNRIGIRCKDSFGEVANWGGVKNMFGRLAASREPWKQELDPGDRRRIRWLQQTLKEIQGVVKVMEQRPGSLTCPQPPE